MDSGLDDVLEGYEVPRGKWTSKQGASTSNPSLARIDERRRPTSGGSGSHSFLGKYGVGACLTPPQLSQKGDTSATMYWMRRMGMMENKIKSGKSDISTRQTCRRHVQCPSQGGSKGSRSRRSLRAVCGPEVAQLEESIGKVTLDKVEGVVDGSNPGVGVSAALPAVPGDEKENAEPQGEKDLESELMRDVLLNSSQRSKAGSISSESFAILPSGCTTPLSQGEALMAGKECSRSDNGDSWSLASAGSSCSLVSAAWNHEAAAFAEAAAGAATHPLSRREVGGYRSVLLMSDDDQ